MPSSKQKSTKDDKLVDDDVACCDLGDLLRAWYNSTIIFRVYNKSMKDNEMTVVMGSGRYKGKDTNTFINKGAKKLLFFSYRNCFTALPNGDTTDSMWGCLARTSQMLMAAALMQYYTGGHTVFSDDELPELRAKVQKLFMDVPTAPFSIHMIEDEAFKRQVQYGTWLSPSQAGEALEAAAQNFREKGGDVPFTLCCSDRNIPRQRVLEVLRKPAPVLLLIPVSLGLNTINGKYEKVLLHYFDMDCICGAAGGYREASFYMFGKQGRHIFFLDPHYVQRAYRSEETAGKLSSARGALQAHRFNPCMLLSFYIHNEAAYNHFEEQLVGLNSYVTFPLITTIEPKPVGSSSEQLNSAADGGESTTPAPPPVPAEDQPAGVHEEDRGVSDGEGVYPTEGGAKAETNVEQANLPALKATENENATSDAAYPAEAPPVTAAAQATDRPSSTEEYPTNEHSPAEGGSP